ncbi:hypothetical protein BH23ACT5_BH23ACT5_17200 [soil metagenome]
MENKDVLYAVVGAPVAAVKSLSTRAESIWAEIEKRSGTLGETAQQRLDEWATEGRQVVNRVSDGKMVDELASKVDFDQAREQVSKLRDQLEEMLSTWRTSFRPVEDSAAQAVRAAAGAVESAAGEIADEAAGAPANAKTTARPAGSKPAAKKTATKPAAKKTTAKPAAKKSTSQASQKAS